MQGFDLLAKRLAPYYSYFQVSNRLIFTGHSHQAWPDLAFEGQKEAFMCAAGKMDAKWEIAFKKADKLRDYLRTYYQDEEGYYSFASNTHELLLRCLSALDLHKKQKIITTDGEFYTLSRQLTRLEEEGITVVRVPHDPPSETFRHIQEAVCSRTAAILCSHIFYRSALINTALYKIAEVAKQVNIPMIIDDYHGTNVVPLRLKELSHCYVLGGGYKYLQWGEGNGFLRFPKTCMLRPALTGWLASFEEVSQGAGAQKEISYDTGNMRFSGATYDPSSQFRAARVVDFFREQQLSGEKLRDQYQAQLAYMQAQFLTLHCAPEQLKLLHDVPATQRGGFLALQSPKASEICVELHKAGVSTDVRGDVLRFGAAPYIQKRQIQEAFRLLKAVLKNI